MRDVGPDSCIPSYDRKRVIALIQYEGIKKALGVDIAVSPEMAEAIYRWQRMYRNKPPWLSKDVRGLNLPAAISSEYARLVTNEVKIEVSGSTRAAFINRLLEGFKGNLRKYVEFAGATGGICFKPYPTGNTVAVDVVRAGNCYPTEFDSAGSMTGAIFPEFRRKGKKLYTRLEYHSLQRGRYIIVNRAFVSTKAIIKTDEIVQLGMEIRLEDIDEWADISPYEEFHNADCTLFSYLKIPMANNIDPDSPLGVAVYSRSERQIQDADEVYGATLWEYKSKETAIQASNEYFKKNRQGDVLLPKGQERLYYPMGNGITDPATGKPLFNVYSPDIRDQSFFNGYNRIIQKVEFNCGLAYGTLSDPQSVEKTAEEIKASRQRSYSTVKDIQNSTEEAIRSLVRSIEVWIDWGNLAPPGKVEVSCDWDDSLIVDKKYELEQLRADLAAGIIGPVEFRMKRFGETEEQAKEALEKIQFLKVDQGHIIDEAEGNGKLSLDRKNI